MPVTTSGPPVRRRPATGLAHPHHTWIVAFTSTSARETSFRPPVKINDRRTLVLCDQIATVDLNRLAEPAGFLTLEEIQRVDDALMLVLGL